jgi:hypothetical protein
MTRAKRIAFKTTAVLVSMLLIEILSYVGGLVLPQHDLRRTAQIYADQSQWVRDFLRSDRPRLLEIHAQLGWRYAANFNNETHGLNSRALRADREYAESAPPGVLRVAAFGDSFVYSSEVSNGAAWAAIIESQDSDIEVLNYGVGGYGVDQAYLRYLHEGADLRPHVVILGFTTDDLGRVVNVYRRFVDARDGVLFKPRFILRGDDLMLLESPVTTRLDYERLLDDPRRVLIYTEHDYWYQPGIYENVLYDYSAAIRLGTWLWTRTYRSRFDPDRLYDGATFSVTSTAYRLHIALFRAFADRVEAAGARPLVVMLPDRIAVRSIRTGGIAAYEPLVQQLRRDGIPHFDVTGAFRAQAPDADQASWFAPMGHYSEAGNKIVGSWLRDQIRAHVLTRTTLASEPTR